MNFVKLGNVFNPYRSFLSGGRGGGGRGTLGIPGCGCAAGTLEPLTYTRASSAEFCNIHLQSVVLALTSRVCEKGRGEEGGANRYTEGHTKNRIRELKQ